MSINKGIRLAAGIAGIATIVLALIMLSIFPKTAELPEGFHTPIIAFEFAKTEAALFSDKQKTFSLLAGVTSVSIAMCWLSGSNPLIAEIMAGISSAFFLAFSVKAVVMAWQELKPIPIKGAPE